MTSAEDRCRTLLDASSALADQPTVKGVLQSVRRVLSSISRVHGAELYVLSDDGESLYTFEFDRDADAPAIKIGAEVLRNGAVARVLDEQEPVFIPDLGQEMLKHPDLAPYAAECVGRSTYLFPVSSGQKRYGVLSTPKLPGQQFAREEIEMLRCLASHVAVALECALAKDIAVLYQREVEKERDLLRVSRDDLRRSKAYLAEAQSLSHTGSWAFDVASNKYLYISEECSRIFELDPKEGLPIREAVFRLIHPEDRDKVQRDFEKLLRERVDSSSEFRIVLPSGATKHVQAIRHPVLSDAGVVQVVGTVVDITERKRAENELQRTATYLEEAQRLTHTGSWALDGTGQQVYWSEEVYRIWGFDSQRGLPTRDQAIQRVHPEDIEKYWKYWQAVYSSMRDKIGLGLEFRIVLPDGTVRYLHGVAHPILNDDGDVIEVVGVTVDITERKRAEEALRRSEAYLTEAQNLTHTGSWAFDVPSGTYTYASEEDYRIWGFDPREGAPSGEVVLQRVHPDDRNKWKAGFEKPLREKTDSSDEYRIVLPDGTIKHIYAIRHPILNQTGDVVTLVGSTADITERKRAEEELRRSEAQLAHERDCLSLLLEINNHIVSKLDVDELFQAVAASVRKHFANDVTSFLLLNKKSGCLECKFLDFPTGRGILEKVAVVEPSELLSEWWRRGKPVFYSPPEAELPPALREADRSESILSAVSVPLVGVDGPLGLLNIASKKPNAFSEGDRDLLSQIGTQISLALDNALVYGRLRTSRDNLEHQRLYLESEISSEFNFEDIVGKSSAIKRVFEQVSIVSPTDSTVLLHGETGTGKELIARAIHNLSSRRDRTFVRMNCAAIPSGLLESELFGHEKGAFTGALMQKKGRFELADHGSLFLDEIGDISLELQPKLLRAVQEHEFERLGSARTIQVDVRIIAATHRDLSVMIREGKFREDLFYRLNVFPIEIPPLRERREDIPLLVNYFVSKVSRRMGKKIESIPKLAMEVLANASWPGNVRELQNFIERAVILTQGSELNVPIAELRDGMPAHRANSEPTFHPASTFHDAERQAIIKAMRAASGRIAGTGGAAERLGLKRTTLQNKIRRLQITRSEYAA